MSAPKPELTAELQEIVDNYGVHPDIVREVVEIVARKSAEIADQAISQDASGYASTAILTHWGLK